MNLEELEIEDKIAREVISNILVHREYSSSFPAKLTIDKEKIYTENWNKALAFGKLNPNNFTPYPKNPILAKFFMNINRADSLGSGVRNLYKFTKIYSDSEPDLEEDNVFRTTIPLIKKVISVESTLESNESRILDYLKVHKKCTATELLEILNFRSKTSIQKILLKMIEKNIIQKIGKGKNTFYCLK